MSRVFLLILDSFGVGASLDAVKYGDVGADTFGNLVQACSQGIADAENKRSGDLQIPNLNKLGLSVLARASTGKVLPALPYVDDFTGLCGYAVELSAGKDTPSGHWEMMGVPVLQAWHVFPNAKPAFPEELVNEICSIAGIQGILGNERASGTEIIVRLGEEHIASGLPIMYTSADSVLQVAAHEEFFGLEKLYKICEIARDVVDKYCVGRVIARPFIGESGSFTRTANRVDYGCIPPKPTLLDYAKQAGCQVYGIGKIGDIFSHRGFSQEIRVKDNADTFDKLLSTITSSPDNSFIFANFADFDTKYGHRRDIIGYAHALEYFDSRLPEAITQMQDNDWLIISADHGCDTTFPGSDHTREHIPILAYNRLIEPRFIGRRETIADIGQTIAKILSLQFLDYGVSFV